jgi:hypothetical protein
VLDCLGLESLHEREEDSGLFFDGNVDLCESCCELIHVLTCQCGGVVWCDRSYVML